MHVCICVFVYAHTHKYTHARAHTHTHTHGQRERADNKSNQLLAKLQKKKELANEAARIQLLDIQRVLPHPVPPTPHLARSPPAPLISASRR
jgi:hypothetical protein